MAQAVALVDPLGVQLLVILEADGRAVPETDSSALSRSSARHELLLR
jgi:hypothetical protein